MLRRISPSSVFADDERIFRKLYSILKFTRCFYLIIDKNIKKKHFVIDFYV